MMLRLGGNNNNKNKNKGDKKMASFIRQSLSHEIWKMTYFIGSTSHTKLQIVILKWNTNICLLTRTKNEGAVWNKANVPNSVIYSLSLFGAWINMLSNCNPSSALCKLLICQGGGNFVQQKRHPIGLSMLMKIMNDARRDVGHRTLVR